MAKENAETILAYMVHTTHFSHVTIHSIYNWFTFYSSSFQAQKFITAGSFGWYFVSRFMDSQCQWQKN